MLKKFSGTVPIMIVISILVLSIGLFSPAVAQNNSTSKKNVLVFTKTEGYRHESIPVGVEAIQTLAAQNHINITHTEDAHYFHPDSLSNYDGVVFLSTSGNVFNPEQQQALKNFIQSGGGFMGVHAATTTEYKWPWYGKMIGAYFDDHPEIQKATIKITDHSFPATSFLPKEWVHTDEWYNFKQISEDIHVLMEVDEDYYEGGTNGPHHPIAWYHHFEGGRVFYTGLGHAKENYSDPNFLKHLEGGLHFIVNSD